MKRMLASAFAAIILSFVFLAWMTPELASEPIGEDDLAPTKAAAQSRELSDAITKFKEQDFDSALKLLKAAARRTSDLPPAHVIMAQLFSQANIPAGVRTSLEQAAIESPDDPETYLIMGEIAIGERRIVEAELLFQKAESLLGTFNKSAKRKGLLQPRVFSGLAGTAEARQDWVGAQKQLEAWLKIDPESATAMQRLAQCLFQQKDPVGALEKLTLAAKANPDLLTPEAILAKFYERSGDHANAKKWMIVALKAKPKDLNTRLVAAQWALETGQLADAKVQAEAAIKLDPKSLDAKILRGVVALFQKNYKDAELYFEAAHLQSPGNFAASNNLALSLLEQKDGTKNRRALEYAQANVKQNQKSVEALSTYGWALYKLGRLDEAEKALRAVVSSGGASPDAVYYLARLLADRAREADAIPLLQSALKNTGPFAQRAEAQALLEELQK